MSTLNQEVMMQYEWEYHSLIEGVLEYGEFRQDRTGVGTRMVFAPAPLVFDLQYGFPLLVGKKVHAQSVFTELCWFLRGDTNIGWLREHGCSIWDEWAAKDGGLGPVYGKQWRNWDGHDQIMDLVHRLADNPYDRRMVLSAWNVGELGAMALPPCHYTAVFGVTDIDDAAPRLNCLMVMRSADLFLGVPFNIASYAALVHVLCGAVARLEESRGQESHLRPGILTIQMADAHVYRNHKDAVRTYLDQFRKFWADAASTACTYGSVEFVLPDENYHLRNLTPDCFRLTGYNPMPAVKAPVAV